MNITLHGTWQAELGDGAVHPMTLPGTLDENQIGFPDTGSNPWHPEITLGNTDEAFQKNRIATRFTRRCTYEGEARLSRTVDAALWRQIAPEAAAGKRIFLEAERTRVLRLFVDGQEIPDFTAPSISTTHIFELTGLLREGSLLTLLSDNSYPGLPHDDIVYSSAATDETQTNWNGILGYLRLRTEMTVFADEIRVYPSHDTITVKMNLHANQTETGAALTPYTGTIRIRSGALREEAVRSVTISEGTAEITFEALPLRNDVKRWDLNEGNLYELTVSVEGGDAKTVTFGVRDFGDNGHGRLAVNGHVFFLRGEANCAVFPETGHPPMTEAEWLDILSVYRSYGVNCMRFHSHCPPEAAFAAADRMGMLMQPELSHWNPKDALETDESFRYYRTELIQILRTLANHPSFVMLSMGNELQAGPVGEERLRTLVRLARETDPTRLYATASNAYYGAKGCDPENDFYTSHQFYEKDLRGTSANMTGYINHRRPNAMTDYTDVLSDLRKECGRPVFSFEVGQYEILPDFGELGLFRGVTEPANLELIRDRAENLGISGEWNRYVEATGEISRIGYREEAEAVMRTEEMSGISLLGLQDFPGQGTALVGMLNSHLQPKPYEFARPEHFRSFFTDRLPLVLLPRYTWENTERIAARIKVANYGKEDIRGNVLLELSVQPADGKGYSASDSTGAESDDGAADVIWRGSVLPAPSSKDEPSGCPADAADQLFPTGYPTDAADQPFPAGRLTDAGLIEIPLDQLQPRLTRPVRLNLTIYVAGTADARTDNIAAGTGDNQTGDTPGGQAGRRLTISNRYPIWVYPHTEPVCPETIWETRRLGEKALEVLRAGGRVYLSPPSTKEALPNSIRAQFTTDFWSVGTFAGQPGGMGQLIDDRHPLFEYFPTEFHTNWQWWPMASQRAAILPKRYRAIVTEMDSYAFLRPMAQLMECRCGGGKLMFSSMGLQDIQQYPEARALLDAIYTYMDSDRFEPEQEIDAEIFEKLVV